MTRASLEAEMTDWTTILLKEEVILQEWDEKCRSRARLMGAGGRMQIGSIRALPEVETIDRAKILREEEAWLGGNEEGGYGSSVQDGIGIIR